MDENAGLALIALGSNKISRWGDAAETIQKAYETVAKLPQNWSRLSGLYRSEAFPKESGPPFVNAAMVLKTSMAPYDLLAELHEIEHEAGRERNARWGPRTLDLDLIAVDDALLPDADTHRIWRELPLSRQAADTPRELILPHPRLQDRGFVLVPLLDVAPDWVHPVLGQTVAQMAAALPASTRAGVQAISPL